MTPSKLPSPYSIVLSFEQTAGPMLVTRSPFEPGTLVRAMWLRGFRGPGFAEGFGGTIVDRTDLVPRDGEHAAGPYRNQLTSSVRDVALPLSALDELALRLRATGLPERTPSVRGRVDTSDGWVSHRLSLHWDDRPPTQLVAHAMASGYEGPDAASVEALFQYLVALGRSALTR